MAKKTALEHVNDFIDGVIYNAVGVPVALGDFLARISGFRDWQNESVIDLGNPEQTQVLLEAKIIYEALTHEESFNAIKDSLVEDMKNRPAYYIGGLGVSSILSKTLLTKGAKTALFTTMSGTKIEDTINEKYNNAQEFLSISDNDFNSLVTEALTVVDWLDDSRDTLVKTMKDLGLNDVIVNDVLYNIKHTDDLNKIAEESSKSKEELLLENSWLNDEERVGKNNDYLLITQDEMYNFISNSLEPTTNPAIIDNSKLDLDIHTNDPLYEYSGGLLIGGEGWNASMPDEIVNGDGWLNVEMSKIVSDNYDTAVFENPELNIAFSSNSALRAKNTFLFTNVNSYSLFSSCLDLKENSILTSGFYVDEGKSA